MSAPEVTIWAKPAGRTWNPIGSDQGVDVLPESVQYEFASPGGASTASFALKRHTRTPYSDLGPFTPILIEVGGRQVWRGRTMRTPKQRGDSTVWDVECEGMYSHLGDDKTGTRHIHSGSGDFQDARQFGTNAADFSGPGEVDTEAFGKIILRVPSGSNVTTGEEVGVLFDAGPDNTVEEVYVDWATSAAVGASYDIIVRGSDDGTISTGEATTIGDLTIASGTDQVTFVSPHRYVLIYLNRTGGTGTTTSNHWFRANIIRLFTSAAHSSAGSSVLLASDVIKADLSEKCPLISGDHSQIADTSTVIPAYWPEGYQTPRERIEGVLWYDASQFTLISQAVPLPRLRTIPTRPVWVYDAATDGGQMSDGGANDGQEIYNQAIVTYTDDNGVGQADLLNTEAGSVAFSNPSFTTNATDWVAGSNTTIARVTSQFDSSPASLAITSTGASNVVEAESETFTAAIKTGRAYTVRCRVRVTQASEYVTLRLVSANGGLVTSTTIESPPLNSWMTLEATYVTTDSTLNATVRYKKVSGVYAASVVGHADTFTVTPAGDTLIDRHGFKRTIELSSDRSSATAAAALASSFLTEAQFPPFKGSLTLRGHVRKYGTDEYVPVGWMTEGDPLIVLDETDITTGAGGRIGIVTRVGYTHDDLAVDVDLDSRRDIIDDLVRGSSG